MSELTIAAIVPAAGQSKRFGSPKMLFQHQGQSLLEHTLNALEPSQFKSIIVVTGKHSKEIKAQLNSPELDYTKVDESNIGLAHSIAAGLRKANSYTDEINSALILLGDQIFVTKNDIGKLLDKAKNNHRKIICARYQNTLGVPCILPKQYFPVVQSMQGDQGAKLIIQNNLDNCLAVDLPNAAKDIDQKEDLMTYRY